MGVTRKLKRICNHCVTPIYTEVDICPKCASYLGATPQYMPPALFPETILHGHYYIGGILGSGGFGITYMALDLRTMCKVAIKEYYVKAFIKRRNLFQHDWTIVPNDDEGGKRFQNGVKLFLEEGRKIELFNYMPNIVSVRSYFRENQTAYLVMEFIEGITLQEYLKQNGMVLTVGKTMEFMKPVIHSLITMHEKQIVHRDISPDNIMIDRQGRSVLIDFGAASKYDNRQDIGYSVIKKGYAPPEQYSEYGNQGPWTDVYGVCATIYRMITGKLPQDSQLRMKQNELVLPSTLGVSISPKQEMALMRGLELSIAERYSTLQQLYLDLYEERRGV